MIFSSMSWNERSDQMKMTVPSNARVEEEDLSSGRKEWPIKLLMAVSFLLIFTAGAILKLPTNMHFIQHFSSQYKSNLAPSCSNTEIFLTEPGHLLHNMTDEELLWRASVVPKRGGYPFKRVPKVAFMFLARGPLPFLPLWERFFKGHEGLYSVYLHTTPGYMFNASKGSPFYSRQIPSKVVEWGSISLVDAERRLLANALLDFSNERFILLSESCIPVYNFTTVYKYLTESAHSFVECYDKRTWDARGRYRSEMLPDITINQFRKGSQWFEVDRELAVNIIADTKYYSLFRRYGNRPWFPDEHYIPTFLHMFYPTLKENRSVTWVDWSIQSSHPPKFGKQSISERFIQSIRISNTTCLYNSKPTSVCFLFARKFDPSALEPLLSISSTLLGF